VGDPNTLAKLCQRVRRDIIDYEDSNEETIVWNALYASYKVLSEVRDLKRRIDSDLVAQTFEPVLQEIEHKQLAETQTLTEYVKQRMNVVAHFVKVHCSVLHARH
jgi:hypothetical protein